MQSCTPGGEWPHAPLAAVDLVSGKQFCNEWPGGYVDSKLNTSQQMCPSEMKAISELCWIRKSTASTLREVILFFRPGEATFVVLCPGLGLSERKVWTCWIKCSEGPQRWVRVYRLTWENRLKETQTEALQPREEKAGAGSCQHV